MFGRRGILKGILAGAASVALGTAGANAASAAPTPSDNVPWDRTGPGSTIEMRSWSFGPMVTLFERCSRASTRKASCHRA